MEKSGKMILGLLAIAVLGLFLVNGMAWAKAERTPKVMVDEETIVVLADEPDHHFKEAIGSFVKKDMKTAAAEIRKGAAYMKLEAARASDEAKKDLNKSAQALEKLADDVEKGTVTAVKDLEQKITEAHQALAEHHHLLATKAWVKKDAKRAGDEMKAAANALERGLTVTTQNLDDAKTSVVNNARAVGDTMRRGASASAQRVREVLEAVGNEIRNFAKGLHSGEKP
jgi:hypothetical protein